MIIVIKEDWKLFECLFCVVVYIKEFGGWSLIKEFFNLLRVVGEEIKIRIKEIGC